MRIGRSPDGTSLSDWWKIGVPWSSYLLAAAVDTESCLNHGTQTWSTVGTAGMAHGKELAPFVPA